MPCASIVIYPLPFSRYNQPLGKVTLSWGKRGTFAEPQAFHEFPGLRFGMKISASVSFSHRKRIAAAIVAALGSVFVVGQAKAIEILVSSFHTDTVNAYSWENRTFLGSVAAADGPKGISLGPDGTLYVAASNEDAVKRYTQAGGFLGNAVPARAGGLDNPESMFIDSLGNIYVTSHNTDGVKRYFGRTGTFIDDFIFSMSGKLDGPTEILLGPNNRFYVASFENDSVKVYDGRTGNYISDFIPPNRGSLDGPRGMAFGPDGYFYVASFNNDRILRYDSAGRFVDAFVLGTGGLDGPWGIAFAPDGSLLVSSFNSDEVKRYARMTGSFIQNFVLAGGGGLNGPTGILVVPEPATLLLLVAGALGLIRCRRGDRFPNP